MRSRQFRFLAALAALVALVGSSVTLVATTTTAAAAPLDETVTVPTNTAAGASSAASLSTTRTYMLTVNGSYTYGGANPTVHGQADAACTTMAPDPTWQRNRFALLEPGGDLFSLYVNGAPVQWQAATPDAVNCDSGNHTYELLFKPAVAGPVNFAIHEQNSHTDNTGTLTVRVSEQPLVESLLVFSNVPSGAQTTTSLDPSRTYRFEARGVFGYGTAGSQADAQCAGLTGQQGLPEPPWVQNPYGKVLAPNDPTAHPLGLYVNGAPQTWTAVTPTPVTGCDDSGHDYTMLYKPSAFGPVRFGVNDSNYADNSGALTVKIFDVGTVLPQPGSQALPRIELADTVTVDCANPNGAASAVPAQSGTQYMIEASGTCGYGAGQADAECSNFAGDAHTAPDPVWRRNRYPSLPADVITLFVNGSAVPWVPTVPSPENCNPTDHVYRYETIPSTTGLLSFKFFDVYYPDNNGTLTAKIFRIDEVPLGTVVIDSSNPGGAGSVPLAPGQAYRFAANGTYTYWSPNPGTDADAECSQAAVAPYNDPTYKDNRWGTGTSDLLDVLVNGADAAWVPHTRPAPSSNCDPNHAYDLTFRPTAPGSVNFKVYDSNYGDNSGLLTVDVFLETA